MSIKAEIIIAKTWKLQLGRLLQLHGIEQKAIVQFARQQGVQTSPAVVNKIINKNEWPKTEALVSQIIEVVEQFATEKFDLDQVEVKSIWNFDESDGITRNMLVDAHNMQSHRARYGQEKVKQFSAPRNEMLTQKAMVHFGLPAQPFENEINDIDDIFMNDHLSQIRESMISAALGGNMMAVIGECGSGKSILYEVYKDDIENEHPNCQIIEPATLDRKKITSASVSTAVLHALNVKRVPNSNEERDRLIREEVKRLSKENRRFVILVDEAHNLHWEILKLLKCMREAAGNLRKAIGVILIGQPELEAALSGTNTREFSWRCKRHYMQPIGDDLKPYLTFKLARLHKAFSDVFTDDAIAAMQQRLSGSKSVGVGRLAKEQDMTYLLHVNNLCNSAMNTAAKVGEPKVNAEIIELCKAVV